MLDRISQQFASVGSQIPTNLTPPIPYPAFHPSASDRRVNILWLISLVCSLSAALLATLVQQWYRTYVNVIQKFGNPLKAARVRQFLFEGLERLPMVAEVVPGLIHISLILFFWGLGDVILQIDTTIFVTTLVPIAVCVCLYLYCVVAPIWNPQLPYRSPFSGIIWYLIRKIYRSPSFNRLISKVVKVASLASITIRLGQFAMEKTKGRLDRDVRAILWLVNKINESNRDETEAFILSIPGSFHQEGGRDVWERVVSDVQSTTTVDSQIQTLPSSREGTTVFNISKWVRYFFETYSSEGDFIDVGERRMRMRGCVETAASLVCCIEVKLDLFGEVGEVLSALGAKERTNDLSTISSNPLFTMRWTCLSLVAIRKMVNVDKLQVLAKFALDGIVYLQPDYDTMGLRAARRIDGHLKKAWEAVEDILLAFEPWSQDLTISEIKEILNSRQASILRLERIADEAIGVEDVDWRISLLQDAMDATTHRLTRRLPGISFSELKPAAPVMINEAFDFSSQGSSVETTPVPPQLIFPGQQIQSLCTLGQRLRDIMGGQNTEMHEETLKSLRSLLKIPLALRGFNYPMKRQIWRLLDLRDGGGLGFTIELFFLALRQLSPSPSSPSSELKKVFYTGTFKVIRSNWEKSKDSAGTQRILLDILCDLVIRNRGVFSDFSYPPYIVAMLLELVKDMIKGHGGNYQHINDVKRELEDEDLWNRMNSSLREKSLNAIASSADTDAQGAGVVALLDPGAGVGGQGSAEGL